MTGHMQSHVPIMTAIFAICYVKEPTTLNKRTVITFALGALTGAAAMIVPLPFLNSPSPQPSQVNVYKEAVEEYRRCMRNIRNNLPNVAAATRSSEYPRENLEIDTFREEMICNGIVDHGIGLLDLSRASEYDLPYHFMKGSNYIIDWNAKETPDPRPQLP